MTKNKEPIAEVALIGGSGFYDFFGKDAREIAMRTMFGSPSDKITVGSVFGTSVAFIPRHGKKHQIPPHKINYQANIAALKELGVQQVISLSAVGSLKREIKPGEFVVCDQFIDRTKGRADTFFDGPRVGHIEMAYPYCPRLRDTATREGKKLKFKMHPKGIVAVIEGPRFSTTAESLAYAKMGCDIINMTQYPEIALARESGMCYVNISLVTDYDVGVYSKTKIQPVSTEQVIKILKENSEKLKMLVSALLKNMPARTCDCQVHSDRAVL